jgi:UDP-glucose:(heptosyl)LPS alpha-1,3-glucosyltransferase
MRCDLARLNLAIVFERVEPARGGAETYVADLCRCLVREGHIVHLYASKWAEGVLPQEVRCHPVAIRGWTRGGRIWSFARNVERAGAGGGHDCILGLINTVSQDVLIPQGGVHSASLEHNSRRFPPGVQRWAYRALKKLSPRYWIYRAIEREQYRPGRLEAVVAVSRMVQGHLERYHGVSRERIRVIPNAIDAARLEVSDPPAVRRAFREGRHLGQGDLVALFLAHNFRLKGLGPLLEAMALRRATTDRPVHLLVCGGGRAGAVSREGAATRDRGCGPFRGVPAGRSGSVPRGRLLCVAKLLRPLLPGRIRGAGVRVTGDHDRLQRRGRTDDRRA